MAAQVPDAQADAGERARLNEVWGRLETQKATEKWEKLREELRECTIPDADTHPSEEVILADTAGWTVECKARGRNGTGQVDHLFDYYYCPPDGKKLRSVPEVARKLGYTMPKKSPPTPGSGRKQKRPAADADGGVPRVADVTVALVGAAKYHRHIALGTGPNALDKVGRCRFDPMKPTLKPPGSIA
jgi:hypothetical protein